MQDILEVKLAIEACHIAFRKTGRKVPIIANVTLDKYGKMLEDSLGSIQTMTKSKPVQSALLQLQKVYEWVQSASMKATQWRIDELLYKNTIEWLTPLEKQEVKVLHTKANNLFNEKGKETGGIQRILEYSDSVGTKFVIHEITDGVGNIVHRDFDAVRIASGQVINKGK